MNLETAKRISSISFSAFSRGKTGSKESLNRTYETACRMAREAKRQAKQSDFAKTKATGRVKVHTHIKAGDTVQGKAIKNVGKEFYCSVWRAKVRYAYFD